jgi:hypothetical protein
VAIRRAAHQLLDDPRVHDDPLALAILGDAQAAAMRAMGFHGVRDMGPDELNTKCFSNRPDGLRVGSTRHILTAIG